MYAEDEVALIWETFAAAEDRAAAVRARAGGVPLEQVVGWARFGPVRVALAPGVFVPRRRAEAIVPAALALRPAARVVVDLGCGAGALAAWLTEGLPEAAVHGVDLDPTALACARRTGGFVVHRGSWWDGLPADLIGRVDLAVAYLPHVPTARLGDIHPDFRRHEPSLAVDGGADGLDPLRSVVTGLAQWLAPDGCFVTLLSREQASDLRFPGLRVDEVERDEDDVVVAFAVA